MIRSLSFTLSLLLLMTSIAAQAAQHSKDYGYPLDNRYAATIIGTPAEYKAELPTYQQIPVEEYTLKVPGHREIPDVFWYERKGLRYAITAQDKKAPLVFAIAGTGAGHRSAKMRLFQRAFYQAGFHVVTLSSPTVSNFILNASKTAIPGNLKDDSIDLFQVMEQIKNKHTELEISDYYLIGYSLGASQAAFVARHDEQKNVFQFKKVMMINPPLSLFNSVSILDNMLEDNIPGGLDNFNDSYNKTITNVTAYHKSNAKMNIMSADFFYNAYREKDPGDYNMQALIGMAFRMSSSNMIFISDVFNNLGYLVPKNTMMGKTTSLTEYSKSARRVGFSDYVEEIYVPFFIGKTGSSKQQIIDDSSLLSIKDYLLQAEHIGLMHNLDDPILEPGEIDTLKGLFPERAMIYPHGGHCGNMEYKDNVAYMIDFFSQNKKPGKMTSGSAE
ncbi:MAG: alpha/beta hydrolase [gamma proteobacterium symbiont of Bathyaustriella thionipta]|nr:alpha/beta hydrolase [gamma proteobacterium symbiont of Bathyaustriella thionipta]MCU7949135.1 alpha/beta hydrolase [gamma proteobacterium symbiont of Bathyaustriella thionipta]MCU7952246.1 alpha/beta hydrolase [gamma proteobacterium symbiont of Bathyaustriella thionipta]MCU7955796.1 alpha/beta hydrolase [gamma proteobacterium symbiont of Bathyaustriella thionipta]MCU7968036.1 alpha/beta hydrolase [gamma proteobacterium symbiont of Bathyaustriella thionipta]